MLIDDVIITIKAGDGGKGLVHFKRNAQTAKGGPDGGNGGNGGSIYFQGSHNLSDLQEFTYKKKLKAVDGIQGKGNNLFGKNAQNMIIFVPLGTDIEDMATGKTVEITNDASPVLLARGGKGGRGNTEFKSATNQTPMNAEPGEKGEEKQLHLVLRLIADVGLIGLPNAGKSSLLKMLTNADPKIGNYPFTTTEPNLGMLETIILADIPGLIEGASKGKGLGIKFLKHIEKTKLLMHCIDSTDPDPLGSYTIIRNEFTQHNQTLLEKEEIILLTKTDLVDKKRVEEVKKLFLKKKKTVLSVSLYDRPTIEALKKFLLQKH